MAEWLCLTELRRQLGRAASGFALASAGTHALVDEPMDPYAVRALAELGVTAAGSFGRQLDAGAVDRADVVLCATRAHRSEVLVEQPRALRRTFTLREFHRATAGLDPAELDGSDAQEAMRSLVEQAAARRGWTAAGPRTDDDLGDPYGARLEAFRVCASLTHEALAGPIALIAAAIGRDRRTGEDAGPATRADGG
jgi:protein-tyrosine phosphatase